MCAILFNLHMHLSEKIYFDCDIVVIIKLLLTLLNVKDSYFIYMHTGAFNIYWIIL